MRTQSITLKLTPTEYLAIETIMETGKYESRSALLRAGLGAIFDKAKLDKSFDQAIERERMVHRPRPSTARRYFAKDFAPQLAPGTKIIGEPPFQVDISKKPIVSKSKKKKK